MIVAIRNAQTILVPSGERYAAIAAAASEEFDIDFPTFPDNEDTVAFEGREYRRVSDTDIPALVSRGVAHIGFAGLDSCVETDADITFRSFGQPFAYFEVLAPDSLADQAMGSLATGSELWGVQTRYPKLLGSGALRKGVRLVAAGEGSSPRLFAEVRPSNRAAGEGVKSVLRLREIRPAVVLPKIATIVK